jgi:cytochrome c oxidase subunit 2
MSIYAPPADWFKAPHGEDKVWVGLAILWCIVMTLAMPYWFFFGRQNSAGESYRVTPEAFSQRVERFVETNQVGELQGVPIAQPAPGGDGYLRASMWSWYPILKLKNGQTYRLHISSTDLQHGFSLLPLNMNFQILPGYDHVLTLSPTSSGEFSIVCNEFCGIGHHLMTGRILVED